MKNIIMLLEQSSNEPYVFLGNNKHIAGDDNFKDEEELKKFAEFWKAEIIKP